LALFEFQSFEGGVTLIRVANCPDLTRTRPDISPVSGQCLGEHKCPGEHYILYLLPKSGIIYLKIKGFMMFLLPVIFVQILRNFYYFFAQISSKFRLDITQKRTDALSGPTFLKSWQACTYLKQYRISIFVAFWSFFDVFFFCFLAFLAVSPQPVTTNNDLMIGFPAAILIIENRWIKITK